ncbi:protein-export chaperone SecB [Pelagibacteraceae bacterium]|jgi:preprotein translocase subunit SecB|nr:protein-export chaperone SecB [Pelagibacteraceae bacterium]|tara:strand:- start:820 stop:1236 length:417 start_codon:yes stop_codon:yes gene_type:complete
MNYKIIAKYIKKLDFEIPNPKTFFLLEKNISKYKINIDIKSNSVKEKIIEIETSLSLKPISEDFEKINTKIIHSTIIQIEKALNKEELERIILIKIPSEIYSDIRESFVFLFGKSGFKNIKIDESVNFESLYRKKRIQ